jgi:glycosyltransferase involved in cell wall biosynthesis
MMPDKPVKLCLVTRFFDLRNGGIGRFSMEMLKGLQKRGYAITPVSTNRPSSLGHVIYSTFELAYKMPKGQTVYHCLTPMEAIHAPKKRSVVTFHDFVPWLHVNETDTHYSSGGSHSSLRERMIQYYFRFASRRASHCALLACNSEQTRREMIEYLGVPEDGVSVIRFGINPDLKPGSKKDRTFRIGTLCYLDPRKRIDLLIKAFRVANIDGELAIGGTGVDLPRLQQAAEADTRIKFAGFVPDEQMADFINSLDYFIFPSKIEGYGLPIVEALACRKPVIVLSDAILPDEIKANCTIVDNLTDFLKNPRLSRDLEAGYAFAKKHDWNTCVDEYIALYRRLLIKP